MNAKRNLWLVVGIMVFAAALVSGFVLTQVSAEDILVRAIETTKTINDGHAVVAFEVDSIERDASGTFEVWAEHGNDDHGAFRVEVLKSSEEKAQGAIIVSDGETLWVYSPSENKVFVGTPEEAKTMMSENEAMLSEYGREFGGMEAKHEGEEFDHPQNSEEAVAKLLEYFTISKSKGEQVAGEGTTLLKFEPIAEMMPVEFVAVGGFVNLSIGVDSNLALKGAFTGSTLGEFNATVTEFEINVGVDQALFTFDIPADADVVTFADFEPRTLTLEEAGASVGFEVLTPSDLPEGTTLVDIVEVRSTLVQRYTLPEAGSFTIAQGSFDGSHEANNPSIDVESVELRGTTGQVLIDEDGDKVLLSWTEGEMFISIAGDLTLEQALKIAESLN